MNIKKVVSLAALMALSCAALSSASTASTAPDYSNKACWQKLPEITKDVDTFYIYATEYMGLGAGDPDYAALDNAEMLAGAEEQYMIQASAYEAASNVFVPYYRQAGMRVMKKAWLETGDVNAAISGMPYSDITSALDYYFKHYNNNRPFIIAGHSQGSAIALLLLKNYFREHPDYYKRMVAAYVIGYSVTRDDLANYPYLKFAAGESDTGVIISWNTEGKKNVEENVKTAVLLPNAISINPLNWKLDGTYAPASENTGSIILNEKTGEFEIGDNGADAQIIPERGTVVTNAPADKLSDAETKISAEYFGADGRHGQDYTLYYNNIRDNAVKRVESYKASRSGAPDYSNKACWYKLPEITKDVDTFFIYPTEYIGLNEGDPDYAPLDNAEMVQGVAIIYMTQANIFEESTNLFMPYYRQAGLGHAKEVFDRTGNIDAAVSVVPYHDVISALDYYFRHYNNNRPFIIASHSQGSAIAKLILKNYFKEHPDYYRRMIAAYVIGYAVTRDDLANYPHLKFATGESDTGVIISWNTEGRKNVENNVKTAVLLPNAISINPLNWKLDGTYAPASMNLGSLVPNEKAGRFEIADVGADAQVIPERGVVMTKAEMEPLLEGLEELFTAAFGPDGRHETDYALYYNNIKANVAKRIAAYKASR